MDVGARYRKHWSANVSIGALNMATSNWSIPGNSPAGLPTERSGDRDSDDRHRMADRSRICERVLQAKGAFRGGPLRTLLALLDQIADTRDERFRPFLEAWNEHGTKRLKARIRAIEAEWNGTGPRRRFVFAICWIDESFGAGAMGSFLDYVKTHSMLCGEVRFIAEACPGIADVDIYRNLLRDQSACLLTSDRAFHNALCEQRISSFLFIQMGGSTPFHCREWSGYRPASRGWTACDGRWPASDILTSKEMCWTLRLQPAKPPHRKLDLWSGREGSERFRSDHRSKLRSQVGDLWSGLTTAMPCGRSIVFLAV